MSPGADWPNIKNPLAITAEDHERHTSPKGCCRPEDLEAAPVGNKLVRSAMKFVNKKHMTMKGKMHRRKKS